MNQPASSIMQRTVTSVSMDASVADVENVLKSHRISAVPVFESAGVPLGIITTSDLMKFQATGRSPGDTKAWEICSYRPITVKPEMSIREVAELMLEHKIHHVVVMDDASVAGVISALDFVKLFVERDMQ